MSEQGWLLTLLALAVAGVIYFWIRMERAQRVIDDLKMIVGEAKTKIMRLRYDELRLDWLEQQQTKCPVCRHVIFRWSKEGRGWRLHQTTREEGVATVRGAIDIARQDDSRAKQEAKR